MIVLHEKKLIFMKPRKVGGTSFEIALSKYATESSIITPISPEDEQQRKKLGFPSSQNYKYKLSEIFSMPKKQALKSFLRGTPPNKYYNHMPAMDTKKKLGSEIWDSYTKISIIRNPYDFAVSMYFWSNPSQDFETWCLENPRLLQINNQQYKINSNNVIDYFIRYENLKEDTQDLEKKVEGLNGLWDIFSSISAKGNIRPKGVTTQEMFKKAPKADSLIRELYHQQ